MHGHGAFLDNKRINPSLKRMATATFAQKCVPILVLRQGIFPSYTHLIHLVFKKKSDPCQQVPNNETQTTAQGKPNASLFFLNSGPRHLVLGSWISQFT